MLSLFSLNLQLTLAWSSHASVSKPHPLRKATKWQFFLWGCQFFKSPPKAYNWAQTQLVEAASLSCTYRLFKSSPLEGPCDFSPALFLHLILWGLENSPGKSLPTYTWSFPFYLAWSGLLHCWRNLLLGYRKFIEVLYYNLAILFRLTETNKCFLPSLSVGREAKH